MKVSEMHERMTELGITAQELSEMTGIGKSSISQYLSGKVTPPPKRMKLINEALKVEDDTITQLSVMEVSKLLRMNQQTVRLGLQQGVFPWGYAIKTSEYRWVYFINKKRFEEVEGCSV